MPTTQNNSTETSTTNSSQVDGEIQNNGSDAVTEFKSLDEALAHIAKISADKKQLLDEKHQVKRKAAKDLEEAQQRDAALLAEQGKFKELYEQTLQKATALETQMKNASITQVLQDVLKDSGAISAATVMKLVDKTSIKFGEDGQVDIDSVKSVVDAVKVSDPVLFGTVQKTELPPVRRSSEGPVEGSFEKEVAAAKTDAELKKIMAKYAGKL